MPFATEQAPVAPEVQMYVGATEGAPVAPVAPAEGAMSSYVRLRGLPFTASDQEVAQWFAAAPGTPIQVHRVLFTYNTTGRKSGEAVHERATRQPL